MRLLHLCTAAAVLFSLAACTDATQPLLVDESDVTTDIAASAGEAMATAVGVMMANEAAVALSHGGPGGHGGPGVFDIDVDRTRTCFDAGGAVVTACDPISSVRMIVTHATMDGSRSDTHVNRRGETVTMTGAVHRVLDDTLTRVFDEADPPVEQSRVHSGVSSSNDTTTFQTGTRSRTASEMAVDSIRAVTWNLPRATNPWPVSGSIVRNTAMTVVFADGDVTETRSFTRRIQVTFPADAQGNVELQIDDRTCVLNLVTRRVTSCE